MLTISPALISKKKPQMSSDSKAALSAIQVDSGLVTLHQMVTLMHLVVVR